MEVRDGRVASGWGDRGGDEVEGEGAEAGVGSGEAGAAGGEGLFFGGFDDAKVERGELAERADRTRERFLYPRTDPKKTKQNREREEGKRGVERDQRSR